MKTLSVLLPVYNAHETLESSVVELLEVLPELTERFELTILDDGSTDDTADMARDLAARFPQINIIRHPVRLGLAETIQTGLDHTCGEYVIIGDENYSLDPDDLRMLWQLRDSRRRLSACTGTLPEDMEQWLRKLCLWSPRRAGRTGDARGFQIVLRTAFEEFRLHQAATMIARVDRKTVAGAPRPLHANFLGKASRFVWSE